LADAPSLAAEIAEPLLESAPVAFDMAMTCCPHGGTCQAYHAVWQYLRIADLARWVRMDGPLYVAPAERMAGAGRLRRVLISATADYSMLAHLAHGARKGGAEPAFDIVDRCPSALQLNEWYAAKMGLRVRTICSDVLRYEGDQPYDLICTHSFLQWLPVEDRPRLFHRWRSQLARHGRVCFSNRTWTGHFSLAPEKMAQRVAKMIELALQRLAQLEVPLPCERERFADLLRRYGHRHQEHPPLPQADLEQWASDAGLALETAVRIKDVVAGALDRTPGPFSADRGPRMWFQLRHA
jgi:hypothetical protein